MTLYIAYALKTHIIVFDLLLNPIGHGVGIPRVPWGGADSAPPSWNSPMDYFWPIFLHTPKGIDTERSQNKFEVPIFKI